MRKILTVGLVALAAACGAEKEKTIQYGAPQQPTFTEQSAVGSAQTAIQGSLAYQGATQPAAGMAGVGDQLVASLGGYAVSAKMPSAWSAKVARGAIRQAFDTGGMDPACVTTSQVAGVTTVTWGAVSPCHIVVNDVDPMTGDTLSMTVDIAGTLTWNPAAGQTTWGIDEAMDMTMTSGGETIASTGTARLEGSTTVTASTIVASTTSAVNMHVVYGGMGFDEGIRTTLAADLGYQADPFCITSGTLTVEQIWTKRPVGATEASLPDQGWQFVWSGCGAFEVRHGS